MGIEDTRLREIVGRVVAEMTAASAGAAPKASATGQRGVFTDPEAAIAAALVAQATYRRAGLAKRKAIVEELRATCLASAQRLARMAVEETGMGRVTDKVKKHMLVAEKTPGCETLSGASFMGDDGLTTEEPAPFGLIFAVTPTTNPTATLFNNAISMLAAGNAVYFAPHPRALKTSLTCIDLINEAIEKAGGPANLVVTTDTVEMQTVQALMRHPAMNLLVVTGGTGVVDQALVSGKRVIGAAAGNPPVIVDDTADPGKAARDIVIGHSFDNNLPCVAEKEVIVTAGIADELMAAFRAAPDVVTLSADGVALLEKVVLKPDRSGPAPAMIGRNASVILKELGIRAGDDVRCIVVETDKYHPFVRHELMLPVLPVVRVGGFEEAVDVAVEVEAGLHHSAIIHSANIWHMSEFARAIGTTVFVKNAPSVAGIGYGGEGHTSFTIAGRTGEGLATA
ncbi:MAG: aldehyde dehydrogenase, partial [Phyllobacteriaceae bacterium]|nr:aldehyde dehydrogenase [Phyllobacteriaceae bacterium]